MPDHDVAYLEALRAAVRHNADACAIVDRCLSLIARARIADAVERQRIEAEVKTLADELALRFGAPATANLH